MQLWTISFLTSLILKMEKFIVFGEYCEDAISKREKEILDGDELKSHEGMMYGRMYSDWKERKGL